ATSDDRSRRPFTPGATPKVTPSPAPTLSRPATPRRAWPLPATCPPALVSSRPTYRPLSAHRWRDRPTLAAARRSAPRQSHLSSGTESMAAYAHGLSAHRARRTTAAQPLRHSRTRNPDRSTTPRLGARSTADATGGL